jgi:multicomponent K+:H+ antiporter subunit A
VFFGPDPVDCPRTPHEPSRWMRFPIELLVLACVVVGIFPARTVGPLLDIATRSVLGPDTPQYNLAVWHGFNRPLLMSVLALAGGTLLYRLLRKRLADGPDGAPLVRYLDGKRVFERVLVVVSWRWARSLEGLLGTHRLQPQLRWLVCVALIAALWPLYRHGPGAGAVTPAAIDPAFALVWAIGAVCAAGAAFQAKYHRLVALMLAGGAGLATCITFVWFSAPDLALTQLLVEIVTTVLILLGLRWLPKRSPPVRGRPPVSTLLRRLRDAAIAIGAGGGLSMLAYAVLTRPLPETISRFFVERSYWEGGGTNVVNVILVDFRGFDTLGEITVLGAVALTVYVLLRRFRPARESIPDPGPKRAQSAVEATDDLMIPAVLMRALFPVIGLTAVYLLLRGHNLPGGGFVAGLTMAVAVILQYMAGGSRRTEDRLRIRPVPWIGAGLLLAVAAGAGAWLFAYPFLTSHSPHVELPVIGMLPLPSAFMFDLGVFSLVVGATALVLIALAHQSIRSHRAPRAADREI